MAINSKAVALAVGLAVVGVLFGLLRTITEPHDVYDLGFVACLLVGSIGFFVGSVTYSALDNKHHPCTCDRCKAS